MICGKSESKRLSTSSIPHEEPNKYQFPYNHTPISNHNSSGIHSHTNSFAKGLNPSRLNTPVRQSLTLPRSSCMYHPELFITNFCRSSNCQIPLCPECVKMHTGEHRAQGTYGDFERIEKVQAEALKNMESLSMSYSDCEKKLQDFNKKHFGNEKFLRNKLEEARRKLQQTVNNFIDVLGRELALRWQKQKAFFDFELQNVAQKVSAKQKAIEKQKRELHGESHLRYLIGLQTSEFYDENSDYSQKLEEYLNLLDTQMLDLIEDENSVYTLNLELAKYLTIKNADLYQTDSGNTPISNRRRESRNSLAEAIAERKGRNSSRSGKNNSKGRKNSSRDRENNKQASKSRSPKKDRSGSHSQRMNSSSSPNDNSPRRTKSYSRRKEPSKGKNTSRQKSKSSERRKNIESKSSILITESESGNESGLDQQSIDKFEFSRGEITSSSVNLTPPRHQLASNHEFKHNPGLLGYQFGGLPIEPRLLNYSLPSLEYEGVPGILFNSTNTRPYLVGGGPIPNKENIGDEPFIYMMRKKSGIFN